MIPQHWDPIGVRVEEYDVYILDESLRVVGSVQGLVQDPDVWEDLVVRFLGDRGYVATAKWGRERAYIVGTRWGPSHTIDLSDPTQPKVKGGPLCLYPIYPIKEHLVLGVWHDAKKSLKVSLFDVSSAEEPVEVSRYILDDETLWGVLLVLHTFLLDERREIFLLPGSRGMYYYVFSYANLTLKLLKVIPLYDVFPPSPLSLDRRGRAIYIDDWLYIISDKGIVVFDERTWEKVAELEFVED